MFHVEQRPSRGKPSHFLTVIGLVWLMVLVSGCRREDPNPELLDPIFKALVDQATQSKAAYEAEVKKLEEGERELAKTEPFTPERKIAMKDVQKSRDRIRRLQQQSEYDQIRAERRRVTGRRDYRIAFSRGESWPDPEEYRLFIVHQKIVAAPRDWGVRVPKLADRISRRPAKAEASTHEAPKSGHE